MNSASGVFELHVKPTYSVLIPQREAGRNYKTGARVKNESNLKNNQLTGVMSSKAVKRLTNAVNWLVASAKSKSVYDKNSDKRFNFKINFVTLTLPSLDHGISDHRFKSEFLHNFINSCRYKYGLKNFVWKVETQENGNIHAHFTTDTFIHWKDLRKTWNLILEKKGIIDSYREKHSKMTFEDYSKAINPFGKKSAESIQKSFDFGVSTSWSEPNTTDVHAVHSVSDIAAYLAKYMSKKDEDRRLIKGRVWGCSHNLGEKNKLCIELCGSGDYDYISDFLNPELSYKAIEIKDKLSGKMRKVGEIFFYKLADWGKNIKGRLLEAFNDHRYSIRHNLDIESLRSIISPPEKVPIPIIITV
jgi:hypothetical protein